MTNENNKRQHNESRKQANQKQTKQNQQAPQTHLMYQQLISKDISVRPE